MHPESVSGLHSWHGREGHKIPDHSHSYILYLQPLSGRPHLSNGGSNVANERPEFAGDIPCITGNLRAHRYPGGGYIWAESKSNVISIPLPFHASEIVSIPGGVLQQLAHCPSWMMASSQWGAAAGWLGLVEQSVRMHSVVSYFTVVAGGLVQDACGFGGCRELEMSCNILGIGSL